MSPWPILPGVNCTGWWRNGVGNVFLAQVRPIEQCGRAPKNSDCYGGKGVSDPVQIGVPNKLATVYMTQGLYTYCSINLQHTHVLTMQYSSSKYCIMRQAQLSKH